MTVLLVNRSPAHITGCRAHTHPCWEIVIPVTGEGTVRSGKETVPFRTGTAYIVPPHTEHYSPSGKAFSDIYIHVDSLFFPADRITRVPEMSDFPHLAELMYRLYQSRDIGYRNSLNSLLTFLVDLIRNLTADSGQSTLSGKIQDYLTHNLTDPCIDMTHLASVFGYSSDHIRRIYQKAYGCSPMAFLKELRLNQAKSLLRHMPIYSVSDIAALCGFSDSFYFSRLFRQQTGMTPSEYRRCGKKESV